MHDTTPTKLAQINKMSGSRFVFPGMNLKLPPPEPVKVKTKYRISSYSCRGNYSFLNSASEETIQEEETIQGRKLYEEIR